MVRIQTVLLVLLLGAACASAPQSPLVEVEIGVHELTLKVPEGWEHLDHGREHRFHQGLSQISLADFGPVTAEGFRREIEHARELFRNHQVEDAGDRIARLRLRSAFSDSRRWSEFDDAWYVARGRGRAREATPQEVEAAYARMLGEVERLERPELPTLVERALPEVGLGPQREVAEQQPVTIDGRPGLRVETWDRLSHDHRQSYLFLLNESNLLVARMELGSYAEMQPAFEALVASLGFRSVEGGES